MRIYTATTKPRGRIRGRVIVTDERDCLPPEVFTVHGHEFCPETDTLKNPALLDAIRHVEDDGRRVTWQVGAEFYETK